ncbi:hypothetical protein P691DRAFT_769616 [Macrolepiota fuliginosa MF-IS2]|uniref:Uncharacterized protein n=1 Tax=Macrolepiota fuliginosa MF-IS2 TaxID=1400762 RepID=A0A9P5WWI3_9AGAR|nr:hypothetical protein P691DRAFT_769616 [Macrolepiota fuliginosa MF-IS2]
MLFPPDHLIQLQTYSLIRAQSVSEWDQALLSKVPVEYPDIEPYDFSDPQEN